MYFEGSRLSLLSSATACRAVALSSAPILIFFPVRTIHRLSCKFRSPEYKGIRFFVSDERTPVQLRLQLCCHIVAIAQAGIAVLPHSRAFMNFDPSAGLLMPEPYKLVNQKCGVYVGEQKHCPLQIAQLVEARAFSQQLFCVVFVHQKSDLPGAEAFTEQNRAVGVQLCTGLNRPDRLLCTLRLASRGHLRVVAA